MVSIGICDDCKLDIQVLRDNILLLCQDNKIEYRIYTFSSGEELLEYYKSNTLKIIFLDVYMKTIDGIEVGRKLRSMDANIDIIIYTSSPFHTMESYDFFACGYLLKPLNIEKLAYLFNRLITYYHPKQQNPLIVKSNYKDCIIIPEEIEHIESADKILYIHLISGKIIRTYARLDRLALQLPDSDFLRSHQSYIINMNFISCISETGFITKSGNYVPIRLREAARIKQKYISYIQRKTECS